MPASAMQVRRWPEAGFAGREARRANLTHDEEEGGSRGETSLPPARRQRLFAALTASPTFVRARFSYTFVSGTNRARCAIRTSLSKM
jgi:hypothetical protein